MRIEHNILFYILSSTNESLVNERVKLVCNLIKEIFGKEDLLELFYQEPKLKLDKDENKMYIKKGYLSVYFRAFEENLFDELENLPSVLNALFKMLISSDDEPILISGPSSFKTYLAKNFLIKNNIEIVSLNSEITMSQLIGSNVPFIKEDSIFIRFRCDNFLFNECSSKSFIKSNILSKKRLWVSLLFIIEPLSHISPLLFLPNFFLFSFSIERLINELV